MVHSIILHKVISVICLLFAKYTMRIESFEIKYFTSQIEIYSNKSGRSSLPCGQMVSAVLIMSDAIGAVMTM